MKFLVATYGARHIGMLLAHLHSIRRTHPEAGIEVYHQDLPPRQFAALAQAHPAVTWVETAFDFTKDRIQRISSKTLAWEFAIRRQPEGELVCLLDVDTLVRKDLIPFFGDPDCDVIFTFKSGGFVLNTGVLLCRINPRTLDFFQRWRAETIAILNDADRYRRANDARLPYGAADQMALHELLGYCEGRMQYELSVGERRVLFRGEPCETLNETRSVPIADRTHLIHYKGGWQPILLEGRGFSRNRPKADCWEMYLWYLETFQAGLGELNSRLGARWSASEFGLQIPKYVYDGRPVRRRIRYALFVLANRLRSAREFGVAGTRFLARKAGLLPPAAAAA